MLSLLNRGIAAWSLGVCFMTSLPPNVALLLERIEKGTYQTLVFGIADRDKSESLRPARQRLGTRCRYGL